ncbi:NAD-dependent epimerase/dehydratase family protein, partial [bacterium]|nr:NAD-dependent epimerase/dehydratase family protein [bacterium]
MIVVTGGAGFIGSAFVWKLNQEGRSDIIIVDTLKTSEKWRNLIGLHYENYLHKDDFLDMVLDNSLPKGIEAIVHMGACSATTETDGDYLMENNYRYTQILADWALKKNARFIYASSAATYGNGTHGFDDNH